MLKMYRDIYVTYRYNTRVWLSISHVSVCWRAIINGKKTMEENRR